MAKQPKQQTLRHVTGDERRLLERMVEDLELRSELLRKENKLVSAAELMQVTRYLRRLCPPGSRIHARGWNNGDLFPEQAA